MHLAEILLNPSAYVTKEPIDNFQKLVKNSLFLFKFCNWMYSYVAAGESDNGINFNHFNTLEFL